MKRVSPGEPLRISAMEWNRIAELVDSEGLSQTRKPYQGSNSPCIVLGCNQTGDTVEMGMTLVLGGLRITPAENEEDFLSGSVYDLVYSGNGILGVALQPIESGEIGPVVISGHVPVLVSVSDSSHLYANPDGNGYLVSAEDGAVRLSYTNSLTGLGWCNAVLGAGGAVPEEYNGPFKLGAVTYEPPSSSSSSSSLVDGYQVAVSAGQALNTNPYRSGDVFWDWQGGQVALPAFDPSIIYIPNDITYAQLEQWGESKYAYLAEEFTGQIWSVALRATSTGAELFGSLEGSPAYNHPAVIATIGFVDYVTGWVDDPENNQIKGILKGFRRRQLWKWGEAINGVYTPGARGYAQYPTSIWQPTVAGLYVNIYDGPLGAWPVSDTEILVKGGTIERRYASTVTGTTVLADTLIDATVSTISGYSTGRINVFPYQQGVSVRVSEANTLSCAMFVLGDYGYDQTNQRITSWSTSLAGGNGSFRQNTGIRAGYEVTNWAGGGFYIGEKQYVTEPYDATHLCLYNSATPTIIDVSSYGLNQSCAIYYCQGAQISGYDGSGFLVRGYSTDSIGGHATRISQWRQTAATDEGFAITNYQVGSTIPSNQIRYWSMGWRSDGDIQVVGGRIDCGWTTLYVDPQVISLPSSSTYVWLELTYTQSAMGSMSGTLSGAFHSGASIPSSTALTQIMQIGQIQVGSSSQATINLGNNDFLDDESLARYATAIVIMRCL